jgi:hypothetical protein
MQTADDSKLMLRYAIRDEFTTKLQETCNMKSRVCRGGSKDLYHLLVKSKSMGQYMNLDKDHLQIVSGLGHTFIRYKDDANNRFLYIDPTIAQFDPTFDGIFIGDEQDLRDIVENQKNVKGYKLNLGDYLGPSYEGKQYPLPPLKIETEFMAGGDRSIFNSFRLLAGTKKIKNKKIDPSLNPYRLQVGSIYKQQLSAGKGDYKSGKCKKLTRKLKCKDGYRLQFGKEQMNNCSRYYAQGRELRFKKCTRKAT